MSWRPPLAPPGGQNTILIFSNLGLSIPQKSIMGCPNRWLLSKLDIFYRPEWTKGGTTSKSILTIFKYKNECYSYSGKSWWKKNRVICLVSMFPSWVMVCKLSKKCIFYNSVLTSARKLSLLKQFRWKHLTIIEYLVSALERSSEAPHYFL